MEVVVLSGPDWSSSPHAVEVVVPPGPDWSSPLHVVEVVVPPGRDWSSSPDVHGKLPLYTKGDAGGLVKRQERKPLFIMQCLLLCL